jgi:(p)ppGpp synthase/HD superfamily hydrolase
MLLHDLNEFLRLSSNLNYNLSAASLNRYNILMFILGQKPLHKNPEKDKVYKSIAMESIGYLLKAYSGKKRRLGPHAVIHPLRSSALLCLAKTDIKLPLLLIQLFHDILEDIQSPDFSSQQWKELEEDLVGIFERLQPDEESLLRKKLLYLTRLRKEQYCEYIGRLLVGARKYPDLMIVKLADRLDNTMDIVNNLNKYRTNTTGFA